MALESGFLWLGDWVDTGGGSFVDAFSNSLVMIWATELGDKTFFIAAIMVRSLTVRLVLLHYLCGSYFCPTNPYIFCDGHQSTIADKEVPSDTYIQVLCPDNPD